MLKILAIVSILAIALLMGADASTRSMLALGPASPDQSTGPYNPNVPRDDAGAVRG
jgi:hypothetical protein